MPQVDIIELGVIGAGDGAIHADEQNNADERRTQLDEALKRHLVSVDPTAPCACIDGRQCVQTLDGGATQPRAAIAGGQTTPLVAAELTGWFRNYDELANATPNQELTFLRDLFATKGLKLGNHADKTQADADFAATATGCGAADKLLQNVDNMYKYDEAVQSYVQQLAGVNYDSSVHIASREAAQAAFADWDAVAALRALDAPAVEVLATDERGVHGHREFSVVFNFVQDTTVDRDNFVAETDEQIFDVDVWYINKLASAMANGDAKIERALQQTMLAYQIGTYLSLCDGSQTITIIQPSA